MPFLWTNYRPLRWEARVQQGSLWTKLRVSDCRNAFPSFFRLLVAVQEQLAAKPPILGSTQRLQLIHMLRKLAEGSAVVAAALLSMNMAKTVADILTEGGQEVSEALLPFSPPMLVEFCLLTRH